MAGLLWVCHSCLAMKWPLADTHEGVALAAPRALQQALTKVQVWPTVSDLKLEKFLDGERRGHDGQRATAVCAYQRVVIVGVWTSPSTLSSTLKHIQHSRAADHDVV